MDGKALFELMLTLLIYWMGYWLFKNLYTASGWLSEPLCPAGAHFVQCYYMRCPGLQTGFAVFWENISQFSSFYLTGCFPSHPVLNLILIIICVWYSVYSYSHAKFLHHNLWAGKQLTGRKWGQGMSMFLVFSISPFCGLAVVFTTFTSGSDCLFLMTPEEHVVMKLFIMYCISLHSKCICT